MPRRLWIVGGWILFLASVATGEHEHRPGAPPRNMFVDLSVERARHTRGGRWDGSDKSQDVKLTITLNNRNTGQDYRNLTGYFYVVAQHVEDKKKFKLIIKESETVHLLRGQKLQHESSEVHLEFWKYSGEGSGFKYFGHVYVLEDQQGKTIVGAASPDLLWQKLEKLASLEPDEIFKF